MALGVLEDLSGGGALGGIVLGREVRDEGEGAGLGPAGQGGGVGVLHKAGGAVRLENRPVHRLIEESL